jgi:hypothetical protein
MCPPSPAGRARVGQPGQARASQPGRARAGQPGRAHAGQPTRPRTGQSAGPAQVSDQRLWSSPDAQEPCGARGTGVPAAPPKPGGSARCVGLRRVPTTPEPRPGAPVRSRGDGGSRPMPGPGWAGRLVLRLIPGRPAARRLAVHRHMPRGTRGAGRPGRGTVAQHPRNDDPARPPLVSVLAPLRVTPPLRPVHVHDTIRTQVRLTHGLACQTLCTPARLGRCRRRRSRSTSSAAFVAGL